jgi:hypothetical protein
VTCTKFGRSWLRLCHNERADAVAPVSLFHRKPFIASSALDSIFHFNFEIPWRCNS